MSLRQTIGDGWKMIALAVFTGIMLSGFLVYRTYKVNESTSLLCMKIDRLADAEARNYVTQAVNLGKPNAPLADYWKKHPQELTARRVELNAAIIALSEVACDPEKITPPPAIAN